MTTCDHRLDGEAYGRIFTREVGTIVALGRDTDPATPVPSCPDWTMANLLGHVGGTHRWVDAMVRDQTDHPYHPGKVDGPPPEDPAELPDWLATGAEKLLATLTGTDPDTAMWAWGPDHHARFWSRRMVHEGTVHRVDAELAAGTEPRVDQDVAVDGICEFLENLPGAEVFAPGVAKLRGSGETLGLIATDTGVGWQITLQPDGFDWAHAAPDEAADATVSGTASDLYLLVWGRLGIDSGRYEVAGDRARLDHWLTYSAI